MSEGGHKQDVPSAPTAADDEATEPRVQIELKNPSKDDRNASGKRIDKRNRFDFKFDNKQREPTGPLIPLSAKLLEEVTGEKTFENLKRLEIVFSGCHEIAHLETFKSLMELDMIETGVQKISGLNPVRNTLTRLSLCGNNVKVIENLNLPNLRDLNLGDNNITELGGLDHCLRLQKLWIYSNKLQKLENLNHLVDLRELWVQDNKITKIENIGSLVNLTCLNMADNQINDLKELQVLLELPMLKSLWFDDPSFQPCPVVTLEGYRNYVMLNLKQVKVLDGESIHEKERDVVEDEYIKRVLDFNDRVDALKRKNKEQLGDIEHRREQNQETAKQMKRQLVDAFRRLEKLADDGRNKIVDEHEKQRIMHKENRRQLAQKLDGHRQAYSTEVQRLMSEYDRMIENEESKFQLFVDEQQAVHADITRLTELQYNTAGAVVGMELDRDSPDYKFAEHCITKAASIHGKDSAPIVPTRIVRLFNLPAEINFKQYTEGVNESIRNTQRMYYHPANVEELWSIVEKAFNLTNGPAEQLVPLTMEPRPSKRQKKTTDFVLVCRVELGKLYESRDRNMLQGTVADLEQIPDGFHTVKVPPESADEQTMYMVRPCQAVPEFYIRYRYSMDKNLNGAYEDLDEAYLLKRFNYGMESLKKIERNAEEEFRRHRHRMWMELDVDAGKKMEEQSNEVKKLLDAVDALKDQIAEERQQQESIMKEMKNMQHNPIGRKAGVKEKQVLPYGTNISTKQMMALISEARDN